MSCVLEDSMMLWFFAALSSLNLMFLQSVRWALSLRDKLQELGRFLDRRDSTDELDSPLVAILDELRRHTRDSDQALREYLARSACRIRSSSGGGGCFDCCGSRFTKQGAIASLACCSSSCCLPQARPTRFGGGTIELVTPDAQRQKGSNGSSPLCAAADVWRSVLTATPQAKQRRRKKKHEKKVQRLMQQCASLKQWVETAEHSLKSSVAKQRKQLHQSKETERAAMLSKVARLCEWSQQQEPLLDSMEQKRQQAQELEQDQQTLPEASEWIGSPTDARASVQSMEAAQAIEHYNTHAAFGRKMWLRARFLCGVLAARFWDGTNPAGAQQERERICSPATVSTASNFEKWCGAGHLHTSMKVRFVTHCD